MNLNDIKYIQLPKILDDRGNLTFIEWSNHIPFSIMRIYLIYDVPGGVERSGHAYKESNELIIALSGSFDLIIDDGIEKKTYSLNRSYNGILVPKEIWRSMNNFSTNALGLVLASTPYNESDYIYEYEAFLKFTKNG